MLLFSFQFIITNIVFSLIACTYLIKLNKQHIYSNLQLLLFSLGIGPVFTSLLLYYLLLFLPGHSSLFYVLAVLIVYSGLSFSGRKQFRMLWKDFAANIRNRIEILKNLIPLKRIEYLAFPLILLIFFIVFLVPYLSTTLQLPLEETDALKYGVLGNYFFEEKSLESRWIRANPKTGFYFNANSAPSFSLFLTWEKFFDSFFSVDKDLYYKSISAYYSILILCVFIFSFSKKSKYLALLGILALLSGHALFRTLFQQHLDSFRIFFLILSWIFLAYSIEKKDLLSILLLGVFSGFAAFAHSIGAIIVILNVFVFFFFFEGPLKFKLNRTMLISFLMIIFGWFHYIIDIIWGFGWIIFDRQVTWWG